MPPALPVDAAWLERRKPGDMLDLVDTRGSRRQLRVVGVRARARVTAEAWDTTYVETGTELACAGDATPVGRLPPVPQYHLLRAGDRLATDARAGARRAVEPRPAGDGPHRLHAARRVRRGAARAPCRPRRREADRRRRARGPDEIVVRILTASAARLEAAGREGHQPARDRSSRRGGDRRRPATAPGGCGARGHGGAVVPPP